MRGIADKTKRKAIFEAYRKNSEILILQETHGSMECETIWESEWGGDAIFNHGTTNARGIAIFMVKGMKKLVSNISKSEDGRQIIFDFQEKDKIITIAAIYAPNTDTPNFFKQLALSLKERSEHKIVIGDFNLTMDVDLDRKNTYHNNNNAKDELEDMMDEYCLKDVWRIQNPDKREYSWFKSGNVQKASRLDFALISAGLDQNAKAPTYLAGILSDHRPPLYIYGP